MRCGGWFEGWNDLRRFDPAVLICKGAKAEGCLTSAQAGAIKKGFAGPKNVYPGFPFDASIAASGAGVIPGLPTPGPSPVGGPNMALDLDVEAAAAAIAANSRTAPHRYGFHRSVYFFRARRQADFLSRPERSMVFAARYSRVLRAAGEGFGLEPALSGAWYGALPGRGGNSRSF